MSQQFIPKDNAFWRKFRIIQSQVKWHLDSVEKRLAAEVNVLDTAIRNGNGLSERCREARRRIALDMPVLGVFDILCSLNPKSTIAALIP